MEVIAIPTDLAKSLVAVGAILKNPTKTAQNPHYRSSYAPLDEILAYIRPVLAEHELALVQSTVLVDGEWALRTTLVHSTGQSIASDFPLRPVKDDPQAWGSAQSYARRYGLLGILPMAGDDDDDANAASGKGTPAARSAAKPAAPPPAVAKPGGNGAAKPAAPPATAKPASNGATKPAAPPPAATKPGGNGAAKPAAPPAAAKPAGIGAALADAMDRKIAAATSLDDPNPALEQALATVLPFGNRNNPGLKGKTLAEAEKLDPGFITFLAENSTRPDIKAACQAVVAARA